MYLVKAGIDTIVKLENLVEYDIVDLEEFEVDPMFDELLSKYGELYIYRNDALVSKCRSKDEFLESVSNVVHVLRKTEETEMKYWMSRVGTYSKNNELVCPMLDCIVFDYDSRIVYNELTESIVFESANGEHSIWSGCDLNDIRELNRHLSSKAEAALKDHLSACMSNHSKNPKADREALEDVGMEELVRILSRNVTTRYMWRSNTLQDLEKTMINLKKLGITAEIRCIDEGMYRANMSLRDCHVEATGSGMIECFNNMMENPKFMDVAYSLE